MIHKITALLNLKYVSVVLYALSAVYFAGVMVRLMLTLTPVVCMLSGIAFSALLDLFFKEDAVNRPEEQETEESSAVSGKLYDKVRQFMP